MLCLFFMHRKIVRRKSAFSSTFSKNTIKTERFNIFEAAFVKIHRIRSSITYIKMSPI